MFSIIQRQILSSDTFLFKIHAPRIARAALPGQFLIVKKNENAERIPLTICDYNREEGTIVIVFKAIGHSSRLIAQMQVGDHFQNITGPLGRPSEMVHLSKEELSHKKYILVGGGVGIAPIYPQVKWLHEHGCKADVIIGAKTASQLFFVDELRDISNLYITTDDASCGRQGLVTDQLRHLITHGKHYDEIIAIGPMIMMKFVSSVAQEFGIHCTVSLNAIMVDGTGMCGACRVTINGQTRFSCVDGPEFDGAQVDFAEAMKRQAMYDHIETRKQLEAEEVAENHHCYIGGISEEMADRKHRVPIREQAAHIRAHNFKEVCLGYTAEEAIEEARRCLRCKNPQCQQGCSIQINIPAFIQPIAEGNFNEAARLLYQDTALPAICGRVCPQEKQCEGRCVLGKKSEPIAIGKLERFIGDYAREHPLSFTQQSHANGHKVAIIGSGPAGLTCAKELLDKGYLVTVFEASHALGGVLAYGIPSFRLPKETVVKHEIDILHQMGAIFENDIVVGRTISIDDLMQKEGFEAVFIGTGAGLPNFMNIPGENLCGVVSANEFLTRNNLLFSYKKESDTPNYVGEKVIVVGGGNVAMDAARTALRLGADTSIVYRRSEKELPARAEEVQHAKEEGIHFHLLCNPTKIESDEKGWVRAIHCVQMQLGEPDVSGRCTPQVIPNSDFSIPCDMVIMAIGTSPNPLIADTTPGLKTTKRHCIETDEITGATSRPGIFCGGDAATGAATVILAMGAGKRAATAIDQYIQNRTY